MKLIFATLFAAGLATSALAGNSDRANDLRFDTAVGHVTDTDLTLDQSTSPQPAGISTRNKSDAGSSYPYINPFGIGPDNDSR